MRLQWPEIRTRAAAFAEDWKLATRESADKQTFWNEFVACFGIERKQVAVFERRVQTWDKGGRASSTCSSPASSSSSINRPVSTSGSAARRPMNISAGCPNPNARASS